MSDGAVADLLRLLTRRRRLLVAGLVVAAVATALPLVAPAAPTGTSVLVAARELASGVALGPADVRLVELPAAAVPSGALTAAADVQGRTTTGPVRRGEPLTDVRLLGPALLSGTDLVATPVRLADPATALLLRSGDVVDVLGASTAEDGPPWAEVVAAGARVLAVPAAAPEAEGALVVVAVPVRTASRLASAAVSSRLSVIVRPT